MDKQQKDLWIQALKSGRYKKGKSYLRDEKDRYCCLGVAADIFGKGCWKLESHECIPFSYYTYHENERACNGVWGEEPAQLDIGHHVGQLVFLNDFNDSWDKVISYIEDEM